MYKRYKKEQAEIKKQSMLKSKLKDKKSKSSKQSVKLPNEKQDASTNINEDVHEDTSTASALQDKTPEKKTRNPILTFKKKKKKNRTWNCFRLCTKKTKKTKIVKKSESHPKPDSLLIKSSETVRSTDDQKIDSESTNLKSTNQENAEKSEKAKPKKIIRNSEKSSSVEKSQSSLKSKSAKNETKVNATFDYSEHSCPVCHQNAATVASLYASEMNKDTGTLHVTINNYYSDKWEKQMHQTRIKANTRTVQTSVRPKTRDSFTSVDKKFANDNIQYINCPMKSSDDKLTFCTNRKK